MKQGIKIAPTQDRNEPGMLKMCIQRTAPLSQQDITLITNQLRKYYQNTNIKVRNNIGQQTYNNINMICLISLHWLMLLRSYSCPLQSHLFAEPQASGQTILICSCYLYACICFENGFAVYLSYDLIACLKLHIIITSMRVGIARYFSTTKHFLDDKLQNVSLVTHNKIGSLHNVSKLFTDENVNMTYIKSYFANAWTNNKKYCLDLTIEKQTDQKINLLKQKFSEMGVKFNKEDPIKVPWFPRKYSDLDLIGKVLLNVKDEVNKDHPQFKDKEYRKRRDFIADVAASYKLGEKIPEIPYTKEENDLWRNIYSKLSGLHKNGMSKRYLNQMAKLQKQFLFSKRIPQLNELNTYLKNKTGFTLKPIHGILSHREFLNCFAFRVFCCTQYIRHTLTPQYTPEPDIVHQIVGHIPMFADPDVAELSHQIGLLSLGATDEQLIQLGTIYWFTLQFGACLESGKKLGYGAGIASSIAQIENLLSQKPQFKTLNILSDYKETYPIQSVQESYRLTETFEKSLTDIEAFGKNITKPITTTFNFEKNEVEYDRNIEGIDVGDKPIQI